MAIRREMKYTMNLGIFEVPSNPEVHFVGGSPVTISGGSFQFGEKGENDWLVSVEQAIQGVNLSDANKAAPIGVAWFGEEGPNEPFLDTSHATLLVFPLYATLFKGPNEETPPFDPNQAYNVGDLLRPKNITVGGKTYAVWTNEEWGAGFPSVYYGKVIAVNGTGDDTVMVVLFTTLVKSTA